mmetsp:Transcript_19260/g.34275  ORF Transcript_19260/g.34275 Transcript_19260/m.34275 type:complete len:215 (-) Transcript_19260:2194-2838(-)
MNSVSRDKPFTMSLKMPLAVATAPVEPTTWTWPSTTLTVAFDSSKIRLVTAKSLERTPTTANGKSVITSSTRTPCSRSSLTLALASKMPSPALPRIVTKLASRSTFTLTSQDASMPLMVSPLRPTKFRVDSADGTATVISLKSFRSPSATRYGPTVCVIASCAAANWSGSPRTRICATVIIFPYLSVLCSWGGVLLLSPGSETSTCAFVCSRIL